MNKDILFFFSKVQSNKYNASIRKDFLLYFASIQLNVLVSVSTLLIAK